MYFSVCVLANLGLSDVLKTGDLAGIPLPWPQATPPAGWLKCNGQAFDKTLYPKLARAYPAGVLPDLRGEFIRGWDDGRGVDAGRGVLSAQKATHLRTAMMDYNGSDIHGSNVSIGMPFSEPDSMATGFSPNNSKCYAPNSLDITSTVSVDNGVSGTSNNMVFNSDKPNWISIRPRNIAFSYIVKAA
ncbi:phage tail protein [Dickeya sp. DW 0440]|uniref:phage tail protein n=2 Tax=unclassified Dickeya TaxID=2622466 RepID=UPI0003A4C150|nr:phage tail protein [Dickeya sp. DW 0440]